MSDNLPLEVQEEIMKRLPMKPLIQFRSVSKAWKSLTDSSHFIAHYSSPHTHLLVASNYCYTKDPTYVSLVDDGDFSVRSSHRVSIIHPPLVIMPKRYNIIGRSHGLVCFHGYRDTCNGFGVAKTAILWNISIRKVVDVVVPPEKRIHNTHLAFGVCPETVDPKIVKVTQIVTESISFIPWQVEVFTLSTGVWKSPRGNLSRESIRFGSGHGIDGVFYWLATDRSTMNDRFWYIYNLIISFDMVSEEFREINFPNSLVDHKSCVNLWLSSIRKSLVLLENNKEMTDVVV